MNDIDITLYLNEYRVKALADALAERSANTVEDELQEAFNVLYQEYVPEEQRASIEAQIEQEEMAEQARIEASRRFAVYHVRENGEDYHFTSEYFLNSMQAAYRYRRYDRSELSDEPKTFAEAFVETEPLSVQKFSALCDDINLDRRITALLEFDLDDGTVSICDSSDNAWWTYSLHDFSVAAFKAYRSDYYADDCRREIFSNSLAGKEIYPDEDEAPTLQM